MARARTAEAKDDRRLSLLSAALDEFFERGFAAARMDDIAARAGLSKGSIYLYFNSKEDLFTSLIETFAIPNIERFEATAAQALGGVAAIRAFLGLAPALIRTSPVPKIAKILIADGPAFPHMASAYRKDVVERLLSLLADVLREAKDSGEIDIDDPALTARLVVAPMFFSAMWRVVFEHDEEAVVDLDALFAVYEKMLMRALGVKGAVS